MADLGTKRQRSEDESTSLTPLERTEGLARRRSGGMQRNFFPSVFSVSPGEFFTMSPITLMRRFTEDIDRVFSGAAGNLGRQTAEQNFTWMPAIEVRESGNNLLIHADLPGLNENDVKVEVTDEGLVIDGERKQEHSADEGGWHRSERVYGRFYRLIPLPDGAKVEDAKANFRNGVLEISVPISESERKRRQIPISTSGQSQASGQTEASLQSQAKATTAGR
jgi:HSP20 family protein